MRRPIERLGVDREHLFEPAPAQPLVDHAELGWATLLLEPDLERLDQSQEERALEEVEVAQDALPADVPGERVLDVGDQRRLRRCLAGIAAAEPERLFEELPIARSATRSSNWTRRMQRSIVSKIQRRSSGTTRDGSPPPLQALLPRPSARTVSIRIGSLNTVPATIWPSRNGLGWLIEGAARALQASGRHHARRSRTPRAAWRGAESRRARAAACQAACPRTFPDSRASREAVTRVPSRPHRRFPHRAPLPSRSAQIGKGRSMHAGAAALRSSRRCSWRGSASTRAW